MLYDIKIVHHPIKQVTARISNFAMLTLKVYSDMLIDNTDVGVHV